MKSSRHLALALVLSLPSLEFAADAAKPGRPGKRPAAAAGDLPEALRSFDKNGNHQIDPDELPAVQKAFTSLRSIDKNGNGELDQTEIAAATAPSSTPTRRPGAGRPDDGRAAEAMKRIDKNGNKRIDPDEIPDLERMLTKARGDFMKKLDANGNGKLEESEVARLNERLAQGGAMRRPGGGSASESTGSSFRRPPEAKKPEENKTPAETIKPAAKPEKSDELPKGSDKKIDFGS